MSPIEISRGVERHGEPRAQDGESSSLTAPCPVPTRASLLGHGPAVLWLTGLPGAGKSTLATAVEQRLIRCGVLAAVVDGDALRAGLSNGLGFTLDDRHESVRRAMELSLCLAEAGLVVIAALISPLRCDRAMVATRMSRRAVPFAEVFVNAPLQVCEERDPRGLYRKARAGEISSFTGIDSPYEPPLAPALELRTDVERVEQSGEKLAGLALGLIRFTGRAGAEPGPANDAK